MIMMMDKDHGDPERKWDKTVIFATKDKLTGSIYRPVT